MKRLLSLVPVFGVLVIAGALWQLAGSAHAQSNSPSQICRSSIIIDRSGSVGNNMPTLKEQIRRLFQPTGLYDDKIQVAFWSFSQVAGLGNIGNYNAPFHGYVTTRGENTGFMSDLNAVQPVGNTNYQQAFAYDGTVRNPALNDIIEATDILVFMTDGQPNSVNQIGISAEEAGRQAAQKHIDAGRVVIGGSIGANAVQVRVINYVVTGDRNNASRTFTVSTNYNDLAIKLKEQIATKCKELFPPDPCPYNANLPKDSPDCVPPVPKPYSLIPAVSASSTVISGADSAGFTYRVENDSKSTPSNPTDWSIKRLVVDRGQPVDALSFGSDAYRDGYGCEQLRALVNNRATCSDAASGNKVFGAGATTMGANEIGAANSTTVDDSWQVGTKLCYVFTIAKPTEKDSPTDRYSRAACVIVGKRPTVQIHGGDVTVGRYFKADDVTSGAAPNVKGSITTKAGSVNKTFGSWAEYGIFAPGVVSGFASASGFSEGYPGAVATNQELWSRLTFANTLGQYGNFATQNGMGPVTDTAGHLLHGRSVSRDLAGDATIAINGPNAPVGLYKKENGNLQIDSSTLEKGKTIIVQVPNGLVTIAGNVSYVGGAYSSMNELPQLIIIAKNIVINSNVTNVDAWLIAEDGDGNGGTITTCDQVPPLTSEMCNAPLTINGPVSAKQLLLRRTGGSGVGAASGDPAEVINLRADAYLWAYNEGRSSVRAQTTFTTELPPQF